MSTYNVVLSTKELNFAIEAFESQIQSYEQQMAANGVSEDHYADLGNDAQFLREFVSRLNLLRSGEGQS